MCGLCGIVGTGQVNRDLYEALNLLQHRGQDAAGIMTFDHQRQRFLQRRGNGLVRDVFLEMHMERLQGNMGLGHVRYPTAGDADPALAQPLYVNSPYGIALAHNGNLTNARELAARLFREDMRHLNTDSDSEVLLNIFARELQRRGRLQPRPEDVFAAVEAVHRNCRGAYAAIVALSGHGMAAFRDPWGIRPLILGLREGAEGVEYMVASESVALDVLGFQIERDIGPGEAVYIEANGQVHSSLCAPDARLMPCIFEHVYLARPDSIMDGILVYKARLRQGEQLAAKIKSAGPNDIDVVIPVPDTGRVAAQIIAYELGVKFREGLMKNRYVGRTFIMPDQEMRRSSVRRKLNPISMEFLGKNVLLVDDSIVRGNTSRQIVELARQAGARKVYFASAAPPVRHPNVYGIDMPAASELVAHNRSEEEVCQWIGADRLTYQNLDDLVAASAEGNPEVRGFECSVFDGKYITGDIDQSYLDQLAQQRGDASMRRKNAAWREEVAEG